MQASEIGVAPHHVADWRCFAESRTPMPLYFFHLRTSTRCERDEAGLDCADLETAYLQACDAMPGLAADLLREGRNPMDHAFEITAADGTPLLELPFTERVRDTRATPRPHASILKSLSQAERAYDLVASVRQQVETLQGKMEVSRRLLMGTGEGSPR